MCTAHYVKLWPFLYNYIAMKQLNMLLIATVIGLANNHLHPYIINSVFLWRSVKYYKTNYGSYISIYVRM